MALVGAPSRFSVLKTDVADPSERKKAPAKSQPVGNNNNNKKQQANKNKNVKNSNNNANNNNSNTNNSSSNKKKKAAPLSGENTKFEEWKKRDEQLMETTYEKELQEALLMSRLEQEKKLDQRPEAGVGGADPSELKKKGKVTLSLREFHEKFVDEKPPSPPVRAEPLSKLLAMQKAQDDEEQRLRLASERAASAIVAREKIQQECIEKASKPKMVPQEEYDQMLEMKRKQIEHMAKVLNTTNKELAILQEQNADLEKVLAKGEQKKKADLIREVEELRQVKDELTEQIQTLYVALEQEKSKTHQLTQELQKRR